MILTPTIQLHNLTFTPDGQETSLFRNLTLNIADEKIGLVGRNGAGKTTLLKLINGELQPTAGKIKSNASVAYLPQDNVVEHNKSVAEVLDIKNKLSALSRIQEGSINEHDYYILNDGWLVKERAENCLNRFLLSHIQLDQKFSDLSGGEQTRLHLARLFLQESDFILLDEPTNNLDKQSREILYQEIEAYTGGIIVVSHDRSLLRKMDKIIEITSINVSSYGGNYDIYTQQKEIELTAAQNTLQSEIQKQQKAKKIIQERMEKYDRNVAKGNRDKKAQLKAKGRIDKIGINAAKGRSEATNRRIRLQAARKTEAVDESLKMAKSKLETLKALSYSIPPVMVPTTKTLLSMNDIRFQYDERLIINNFSMHITGPDRIAIIGNNGSGKTTLLKLITQVLKPHSGSINVDIKRTAYLDQHFSLLSPQKTILENYKIFNPDQTELECRSKLAQFLFRNKSVDKKVCFLSGGEKLRALLAWILMSNHPPQLIILDEPTNNLDLDSILFLENAIKNYTGALLVVSHDHDFLDKIGIITYVKAPFM